MSTVAHSPYPAAQPPERRRRRVTTIPLQAEILPDGRTRISTDLARGWAGVGRSGTHEIGRAVSAAFDEVERAGMARAQRQPYDLDALTAHVPGDPLAGTPQKRYRSAVARRAAHPPETWAMNDDGTWRSPAGRTYRSDSPQVQSVMRKLADKKPPDTK